MGYIFVPILIVGIFLTGFYFITNSYVAKKYAWYGQEIASSTSLEMLKNEAEKIDFKLSEVTHLTRLMQKQHENIFNNPDDFRGLSTPDYDFSDSGVFYKTTKSGASLYYSSQTTIGFEQRKKALLTEAMDPLFEAIVDGTDSIFAGYFNSYDSLSKYYPFIDNVYDVFGPSMDVRKYNFYYLANELHNPRKLPVWTNVYLDPAGGGWMLSCIAPIYRDGFLEGVSGFDITIEKLLSNILRSDLPFDAQMFVADHQGTLIAMPQSVEQLFEISELTDHNYQRSIEETISKPEKFNVYLNESAFAVGFRHVFETKAKSFELRYNDTDYLILQSVVDEADWRLFIIIRKDELLSSINDIQDFSDNMGYAVITIVVLLFALLFVVIVKNSVRFSRLITKPLEELTLNTSKVGSDNTTFEVVSSEISEIQQLNDNFSQMANQLSARTDQLIKSEINKKAKEKEAEKYLQRSIKDPLTGLYNRTKLNSELKKHLKQFNDTEVPFSFIYLDIDHFKSINDRYGHSVGDTVLKEFAQLLMMSVRENDVVGRFGGEEFVIIVDTTVENANKLAEKLRLKTSQLNFDIDHQVTASFGVTEVKPNDNEANLIRRADMALYRAKASGRNKVVVIIE